MDRDPARETALASLALSHLEGICGDGVTLLTRSATMRDRIALAMRAAAGDIPVLLTGESGTGKALLARAIHAASRRSGHPFVAVNCAAPDGFVESELFGYRRSAIPGAVTDKPGLLGAAHGGTLLLDEIANPSPPLQAKLLRMLKDDRCRRLADVRIVSATTTALEDRVRSGAFRQDLYYRLAAFRIRIPPRERPEDVEIIARHLIEREARRIGRPVPMLTDETLDVLRAHNWPGNVRELENAIVRAGTDLPALIERLISAAVERGSGDLTRAGRLVHTSHAALRVRKYRLALPSHQRRNHRS